MKTASLWLLLGAVASLPAGFGRQAPAPVLKQTFDENDGGWIGAGANSRVTITHQSTFNGAGALKYEYDMRKGVMGAMMLATPDSALAGAKTLRFWVSADHTTALIVTLQEKGGGRYSAPLSISKGIWQAVELSASDFSLATGPGDPADPDGQLDMDAVEAVSIADMHQMVAAFGNADMANALGIQGGSRTLLMDDFSATVDTLRPTVIALPGGVGLDTFARPQVGWMEVGSARISRVEGKPLHGRGLRADYERAPMRLMGLMRPFPRGKLVGMDRISFSAAATKATTFLVQLEESGGGKFNTMASVAEGGIAQLVTVSISDLNPADDSRVKDRRIDLSLVNQVAILDASGMLGLAGEEANTLWIGDLMGTRLSR